MNEKKYYYVKYRERHNDKEDWKHLNGVSEGVPILNSDFRNYWYYRRIIDFYTEITEEEYRKY